jgi:hypothetical protein
MKVLDTHKDCTEQVVQILSFISLELRRPLGRSSTVLVPSIDRIPRYNPPVQGNIESLCNHLNRVLPHGLIHIRVDLIYRAEGTF